MYNNYLIILIFILISLFLFYFIYINRETYYQSNKNIELPYYPPSYIVNNSNNRSLKYDKSRYIQARRKRV